MQVVEGIHRSFPTGASQSQSRRLDGLIECVPRPATETKGLANCTSGKRSA